MQDVKCLPFFSYQELEVKLILERSEGSLAVEENRLDKTQEEWFGVF